MEEDPQDIVTGLLDKSLGNFRELCFEQVRICRAIDRPDLRERALTTTEAVFVDCLAALWALREGAVRHSPSKARAATLRLGNPRVDPGR